MSWKHAAQGHAGAGAGEVLGVVQQLDTQGFSSTGSTFSVVLDTIWWQLLMPSGIDAAQVPERLQNNAY
jgi:hypothetical protein